MTEVRRVSAPGSPFSGRDRAIAAVVSIGLFVAIIKPWGSEPGSAVATPRPSASAAATADRGRRWPATATTRSSSDRSSRPPTGASGRPAISCRSGTSPVRRSTNRRVDPTASPGDLPSPSATPSPAPPSPAVGGPAWPAEIVVGPGDHLLWLGINTPLGWTIRSTDLRRIGTDGSTTNVPLTRLPSDWDDHFAVLGIPVGAGLGAAHRLAPGSVPAQHHRRSGPRHEDDRHLDHDDARAAGGAAGDHPALRQARPRGRRRRTPGPRRSAVDPLPGDLVRRPARSRRPPDDDPQARRSIRQTDRSGREPAGGQEVEDPQPDADPADDRQRGVAQARSIPTGRSVAYGSVTRASVASATRKTTMPLPSNAFPDSAGSARRAADAATTAGSSRRR